MKKAIGFIFGVMILLSFPLKVSAEASIDFILDWMPNTNHTGVFVAQEKGYFEEAGLNVTIQRPSKDSAKDLVGVGKGQFGINFQEYLGDAMANGLPVTAVAAIIDENTSGIISPRDLGIDSPKQLENTRFGTWNIPIELAMVEYVMEEAGADFDVLKLVPNSGENTVISLVNDQFDSAIVYYAWDGIMAEHQGIDVEFIFFKNLTEKLNFYSPVIIANNDYLVDYPKKSRAFIQAVKKGYQFAMEHPKEAADILIKHAPELEDERAFIHESQNWLSQHYASSPESWGLIDEERWNNFFGWAYEQNLLQKDISAMVTSTNEFVK